MTRITRYSMANSSGGHNLSLRVRGVRILIEPDVDHEATAAWIATGIAQLGPEESDVVVEPAAPVAAIASEPSRPVRAFAIGQRVWCNVHGAEGWYTVTEVGTGRNRGRIKISNLRSWCPAVNFDEQPREARS